MVLWQYIKVLHKEDWSRDVYKRYKILLQRASFNGQTDIKTWLIPVVSLVMYLEYHYLPTCMYIWSGNTPCNTFISEYYMHNYSSR